MIQFGIAFFEVYIRKNFSQSVIDYRLFSYITVISTIYSQIVYIVNAVLFCQFTKSCFPFRNHDFRNFCIQPFTQFMETFDCDFRRIFSCGMSIFEIP